MESKPAFGRRASVAILGTTLFTGCASAGNHSLDPAAMTPRAVSDVVIAAGARLRYDPQVIDDPADGTTNACATAEQKTSIKASRIVSTEGLGGDLNGPWTGIQLHALPESLRSACGADTDGVIWVANRNLSTESK